MKRVGRVPVLATILVAVLGVAVWGEWRSGSSGAEATTVETGGARGGRGRRGGEASTPIPVLAALSKKADVPIYLDALGTVQAFNLVSVRAMVDGPLVEVKFKEGQDVKAGDVLARVDPRPYQATLDSAVAKKQQDEATLANSRLDAGRYAKLVAGNYSSAQQSDTARAQVAQNEAMVRGDQAQIDTARTQLSYATISAPFDGRVGLRQVDSGNIVHSADATPITVLTQLQPISVVFTLPQQSLPQVARSMSDGMPTVLAVRTGAAAIDDASVIDRGKLAVLDNQVDPTTGTIKLKATFPNAGLRLWPGGFVDVRMLVATEHDATTVPTPAVQRGPQGPYVFVVKEGGTAVRRAVTVGHEDDTTSIVLTGLAVGEQVVVDGAQRVTDGGKVAVAGPDGNAPDAVPVRERSPPGTAPRRRERSSS